MLPHGVRHICLHMSDHTFHSPYFTKHKKKLLCYIPFSLTLHFPILNPLGQPSLVKIFLLPNIT